jgi:hypothetical protein
VRGEAGPNVLKGLDFVPNADRSNVVQLKDVRNPMNGALDMP